MIKLIKLKKHFGSLRILENANYDISDGESLAIIGPSGCGKSTLLRLIIGLESLDSGAIKVDNLEVSRLSEEGLLDFRKKIGMVFQSSALFDSLNVFENVAFALREHAHLSEREITRVVKEKLSLVDLEGIENHLPSELSGGMQKRVSIARALAFNPKIILYDEPTTGLDPITSVNIEDLMLKLNRQLKVTSVIVTHVMQTVYRVASKVVMLHDGSFIDCGSPNDTKKIANPVVKKFITGGL